MTRLTRIALLATLMLLAVPGLASAATHRYHHRHHHHRTVHLVVRRVAPGPPTAHRAEAGAEEPEEVCIHREEDGTCVVSEWATTSAELAELAELEARSVCLKWEGSRCAEVEIPEAPGTLTEAEAAEVARITE